METAERPEQISISYWWIRPNGSWIARFALAWDHPESDYQQVLKLGLTPEDYGIYKNPADKKERERLMETDVPSLVDEIMRLRKQVEDYERAGF